MEILQICNLFSEVVQVFAVKELQRCYVPKVFDRKLCHSHKIFPYLISTLPSCLQARAAYLILNPGATTLSEMCTF